MAAESKRLLEICIDNHDDALIAIEGGADRLECCSKLDQDGLTPGIDMVHSIQAVSDIPLRIMIRPRAGDFCYEPHEILEMISLIETFKELEVEGFVFGCLDIFDDIDESALGLLSEACEDFAITFHRAFDVISNQEPALEMLREHGVDTILTSGAPGKALNHLKVLKQLQDWSTDQIDILVGSGVMPENAIQIIKTTGITHLHASLDVGGKEYDSTEKVKRLKMALFST